MLELIIDHDYTWKGMPADKSPYRNHGKAINISGAPDGITPGSGVVMFPADDSRILVPHTVMWNRLVALRIDILAKLDTVARSSVALIAGHRSFNFGIFEGALEASFENTTGNNRYVRSSSKYAPDHYYHPVPINKWVHLGFYHDGISKMRLFIDYTLVGEASINGSIPPVHSKGVVIGNRIETDGYQFPGQIDRVQIWRLNPKTINRQFPGRPIPEQTVKYWQKYINNTIEQMRSNSENDKILKNQIKLFHTIFIRTLFLLSNDNLMKVYTIISEYAYLWYSGAIDSQRMEKVLYTWAAALHEQGINLGTDPDYQTFVSFIIFAGMHCDPRIATFIQLVDRAVSNYVYNK